MDGSDGPDAFCKTCSLLAMAELIQKRESGGKPQEASVMALSVTACSVGCHLQDIHLQEPQPSYEWYGKQPLWAMIACGLLF